MDQPTYEELEVFNQRLGSQLAKSLTAMTEWQHRALTAERNLEAMKEAAKAAK